jgi:dipicolinate synthase subunit A
MENREDLASDSARCIFLGNDKRMVYAAQGLKSRKISVSLCQGLQDIGDISASADKCFLIFPIPLSEKNFWGVTGCDAAKFCENIASGNITLVGVNADEALSTAVRASGRVLVDLGANEQFLVENAYLTAEAAVNIIMQNSDCSIRSQRIALFGYGRISKFLLSILRALGVRVSVYARRAEARSLALCDGAEKVGALHERDIVSALEENDVVINTVPYPVLDENILAGVSSRPYLMDLASLPGGIDIECARRLGYRGSRELGLPAKYAPKNAGETFARAIYSTLF